MAAAVNGPELDNIIFESITFRDRAVGGPNGWNLQSGTDDDRSVIDVNSMRSRYIFNEYYFFLALRDYFTRYADTKLSAQQLRHIIDSFEKTPTGSFLHELYDIYKKFLDSPNAPNMASPNAPNIFNSVKAILLSLCYAVQQDNKHDFYDLGRGLVANFKDLIKKYIDRDDEQPFIHLKDEHFEGLPALGIFSREHHPNGFYLKDTISQEHKDAIGPTRPPGHHDDKKQPQWLISTDPGICAMTTAISGTLDGTGATQNTVRDEQFDCIIDAGETLNSGTIELGIYSFGAMALASMYDLVCYQDEANSTYKYIFYPYFKFRDGDDKGSVFTTKTVYMVLVRINPIDGSRVYENIIVNNRTFTVANVGKDITKVHKTIADAFIKGGDGDISWFDKLKTDNLFMGILKLCVPNNVRNSINLGAIPTWGQVRGKYISNAVNLYIKLKILGKGLGDFNQGFEALVLNNLSNYDEGKFVFLETDGSFAQPHSPTTPLALLTIDRSLAKICRIIGANFLLSTLSGYFFTNPDSIYSANRTLQETHNAFNATKLRVVGVQPHGSIGTNVLYISAENAGPAMGDLGMLLPPEALGIYGTASIGIDTITISIDRPGRQSYGNLRISINMSDGLVTGGEADILRPSAIRLKRDFTKALVETYEKLEKDVLKIILKTFIDANLFICYTPAPAQPAQSIQAWTDGVFTLRYPLCGKLDVQITGSINDIMYKPLDDDQQEAKHGVDPYNPLGELFFDWQQRISYWAPAGPAGPDGDADVVDADGDADVVDADGDADVVDAYADAADAAATTTVPSLVAPLVAHPAGPDGAGDTVVVDATGADAATDADVVDAENLRNTRRNTRLKMIKEFASNKLDICREAVLAYLLYVIVYPAKSDKLNSFIDTKFTLLTGEREQFVKFMGNWTESHADKNMNMAVIDVVTRVFNLGQPLQQLRQHLGMPFFFNPDLMAVGDVAAPAAATDAATDATSAVAKLFAFFKIEKIPDPLKMGIMSAKLSSPTSYLDFVDKIKEDHYIDDSHSVWANTEEGENFSNFLNSKGLFESQDDEMSQDDGIGQRKLTVNGLFKGIELLTVSTDVAQQVVGNTRGNYTAFISTLNNVLKDMAGKFRGMHSGSVRSGDDTVDSLLLNMKPHRELYDELNLEIDTVYTSLFTQFEDAENIIRLYLAIPKQSRNGLRVFYENITDTFRNLIINKVQPMLHDLVKMLIKAKRRYFNLLSIIENRTDGDEAVEQYKNKLVRELYGYGLDVGGEESLPPEGTPVGAAPAGPAVAAVAAPQAAAAGPDASAVGSVSSLAIHFEPEEIAEIEEAKINLLRAHDPDFEGEALEEALSRDIHDAAKEKEYCDMFLNIGGNLNSLYAEYLNAHDAIVAICFEASGRRLTKQDKYRIARENVSKEFKTAVAKLFNNNPFSNIVKFHTNFGKLLALEDRVFQLDEQIKLIVGVRTGGGNMGYGYRKNKKKRKSYMKGGEMSFDKLDKLKHACEKRVLFLENYIVDKSYDNDIGEIPVEVLKSWDEFAPELSIRRPRREEALMTSKKAMREKMIRNASPPVDDNYISDASTARANSLDPNSLDLGSPPPQTHGIMPKKYIMTDHGGGLKTKPKVEVKETKPKAESKKPKTKSKTKPKVEVKETKPKAAKAVKETKPKAAKAVKETKPKVESKIAKAEAKKPKAAKAVKETKPKVESKIAKAEAKKPKAAKQSKKLNQK